MFRTALAAVTALLLAPAAAQGATLVSYDPATGLTLSGDATDSTIFVSLVPAGGGSLYRAADGDPNALVAGSRCGRTTAAQGTQVADCQITGAQAMTANAGGGNDRVQILGDIGPATLNGGGGNDLLGGESLTSPVTIDGGEGQDIVAGGSGSDQLKRGPGPDALLLAPGADNAQGGDDDDMLIVVGPDVAAEPVPAPDRVDGGGGTDLVV